MLLCATDYNNYEGDYLFNVPACAIESKPDWILDHAILILKADNDFIENDYCLVMEGDNLSLIKWNQREKGNDGLQENLTVFGRLVNVEMRL